MTHFPDAGKMACRHQPSEPVAALTPDAIAAQLDRLANRLRHGCGNAGCQIKEPIGMHTNGSCTCQPARFASWLMDLAAECERHGKAWPREREAVE